MANGSKSKYHPLEFRTPVEMLEFYDDSFRDPIKPRKLNKSQKEILELIASPNYTFEDKLQLSVVAANGSGKDAYIICPAIIWLLTAKVRHKVVGTSSSYTQLTTQTEAYVRIMAETINAKNREMGMCEKTFVIKKEFIFCLLTGSTCIMFSTDDPGRAEGHHPYPDHPNAEETIIVNEAKTLGDPIFDALSRCTYNRWIEVSSPGRMGGRFYQHCQNSIIYPEPYEFGRRYARKITSFDCHHKSVKEILQDKLEMGENSPLYRSKHLAEFTSTDEQVVIVRETLDKCLEFAREKRVIGLGRHAGVDFSKGGDENTMYVFDENVYLGREIFRANDTTVTVDALIEFFQKWRLIASKINGDDGHVGGAIIDNLTKKGWPINRVVNQSAPLGVSSHLGNRGAEMYFSFKRLVEEGIVVLPKDDTKLHNQLTSRYYKQHASNGKIILEAKKDARLRGHGSPDRADAVVLAFTGVTIDRYLDFSAPKADDPLTKPAKFNTGEELVNHYDDIAYGGARDIKSRRIVTANGSLNIILQRRQTTYAGNNVD